MTELHRNIFSDESPFFFCINSHRVWVWRRNGDRLNSSASVERFTMRQRKITVWGAIANDSRSSVVRIRSTVTTQCYLGDVLRLVALSYFQRVHNAFINKVMPNRTLLLQPTCNVRSADASLISVLFWSITNRSHLGCDWMPFVDSVTATFKKLTRTNSWQGIEINSLVYYLCSHWFCA